MYCSQDNMSLRFVTKDGSIRNENFVYGDLVFFVADVLHGGAANVTGDENFRFLIQGESEDFIFTDLSTFIPVKFKNI